MKAMMIILLGVFLHSCLIAALEIKNLTILEERMTVYNGTRLLIPCYFETNKPFMPRELHVEWRVSKLNHSYLTILRAIDTLVEPLPQPNDYDNRAQMYLSRIPKGNCSLIINPILRNDTGRYEVRLSTISEEEEHVQQVDVFISEDKDTLTVSEHLPDRKRTETSSIAKALELIPEEMAEEDDGLDIESQDASTRESLNKDVNPELLKPIMWMYFFVKKNQTSLIILATLMLLLFFLFLLGTVVGLTFCYRYFKLKNRQKMDIEWQMPTTTPPSTASEVSPLLTDHE
ncbi:uncharacterized protein LOC115480794 [Microcaecilia unicolor]|uniref:Uncharacterized protein LOC115480794 n=1 Tax=Microcaecilia unicolor TaxID=1415580 RepID=A0A6P7ZNG4_9AMPH|nr:uncharacterized protein LOC115480794 [Microcaecilia unicolor]